MQEVNITELRNHLPKYLSSVTKGGEIIVTSHGQAIARISSPTDRQAEAAQTLKKLRQVCKVKDVISSITENWEANQ